MRIGIDIDGVVADTHSTMKKILEDKGYIFHDESKWFLHDQSNAPKEVCDEVVADPETYRNVPPFKYAAASVRFLVDLGHTPYFVTARTLTHNLVSVTNFWLRENGFPSKRALIFNPDKAKIAKQFNIAVFLEDSATNAAALSKVCNVVFLVDRPHNKYIPWNLEQERRKIVRVRNLLDTIQYIVDIKAY